MEPESPSPKQPQSADPRPTGQPPAEAPSPPTDAPSAIGLGAARAATRTGAARRAQRAADRLGLGPTTARRSAARLGLGPTARGSSDHGLGSTHAASAARPPAGVNSRRPDRSSRRPAHRPAGASRSSHPPPSASRRPVGQQVGVSRNRPARCRLRTPPVNPSHRRRLHGASLRPPSNRPRPPGASHSHRHRLLPPGVSPSRAGCSPAPRTSSRDA